MGHSEHIRRLSLAIFGMLMAAVGLAFNASAVNYSQNETMFKAMNTARQALLRITTEIRTAQSVALIGAGAGNDPSAIRNVSIYLTVSVDNLSQTLATAAVVRRNL